MPSRLVVLTTHTHTFPNFREYIHLRMHPRQIRGALLSHLFEETQVREVITSLKTQNGAGLRRLEGYLLVSPVSRKSA